MKDRQLQGPLANVVVQRRPSDFQELCQLLPMVKHVLNRLAEPGVRLHQPLAKLPPQPSLQPTHQPATPLLMKPQTFLRREVPLRGHSLVLVHLLERLQHESALVGKVLRHLDELTSTMGIAVGHDRLKPLGFVA